MNKVNNEEAFLVDWIKDQFFWSSTSFFTSCNVFINWHDMTREVRKRRNKGSKIKREGKEEWRKARFVKRVMSQTGILERIPFPPLSLLLLLSSLFPSKTSPSTLIILLSFLLLRRCYEYPGAPERHEARIHALLLCLQGKKQRKENKKSATCIIQGIGWNTLDCSNHLFIHH